MSSNSKRRMKTLTNGKNLLKMYSKVFLIYIFQSKVCKSIYKRSNQHFALKIHIHIYIYIYIYIYICIYIYIYINIKSFMAGM